MTVASPPNKSFTLSGFLTSDKPAGFLLSVVAGFVDTAAFIILFGIFTAHVTGNIALAGSSLVGNDEESVFTRLITLPAFMLTVALTSVLARYARNKGWPVYAVLLTAEAIALTVFLVVGATLSPALLLDVQEEYILPIALAGIVAMGIQNTLMKEAKGIFKSYIPTTVMTGNTTQLTIDLVQLISAKFSSGEQANQEAQESIERIGRYVPVIVGFALGGGAAAVFILASETWWTLVMPLMIVIVLAIAAYVEHYRAPAV